MFNFKQIFIFKPDFGPVVVFLGLSPPSWASHVIRMRCPDDSDRSGKVRVRVLDSDPDTQQLYFDAPMQNSNADAYCTVRNAVPDARADAWIRTSVRFRVSILKPGTASFLKLKCKKTYMDPLKGGADLFFF